MSAPTNFEIMFFLLGMVDWVASRLDLRSAAGLFGGWQESNLFA